MVNKKISAEQVSDVLGVGLFKSNRSVVPMDPIETTPMKIPIVQIEAFDKNPRRSKNPEYDAILESLRASGQEEALTITRRPGSENYMIKRGGNTRLEIMKMLFHEANDMRFEIIDCLFMPWTSESDCIVGHLNENTTQGRMTLIDKARGYRAFKIEYEKEHNIELGQRKLASLLKEKGASINPKLLGVMNYALDVLEPSIPDILSSGLGKPQIEKLKRLDQTFQRLADAHNLFELDNRDAQIRAEFHNLLSIHDGDEWDIDLVIHEFTQLMGKLFEKVSFSRIKFDIDLCIKTDPWKVDLISTKEEIEDEPDQDIVEDKHLPTKSAPQIAIKEPTVQDTTSGASSSNSESQDVADNSINISSAQENQVSSQPVFTKSLQPPDTMFTAGDLDLKSIRSRIYTFALQFAQSTGVHSCVVPWNYGYGYFMDLPKGKFAENMSADQLDKPLEYQMVTNRFIKDQGSAQKSFSWWLLWHCQGLLDFRQHQPLPGYHKMPECMMKTLMCQMYNPEDTNIYKLAFSAMGHVWKNTGGPRQVVDMAMAFSYVTPKNMMKYVALLETRTQLMSYVEEHSINLWEERT